MTLSAALGGWQPSTEPPAFSPNELIHSALRVREPLHIVWDSQQKAIGLGFGGSFGQGYPLLAILPPLYPEWLGSREFTEAHHLRFPYVAGAMANGIATVEVVQQMASIGCLGFFGAAGLSLEQIVRALDKLDPLTLENRAWGSNLIHSPNEPELEAAVADLYIRRGVQRVSAAAYMKLSPSVVRYALHGLKQTPEGEILRSNHLFAKISRPEVARRFMSPAPKEMIQALLNQGKITTEEARLAPFVSVAENFTIESDSGGHTDNQPLSALFPIIAELRSELMRQQNYSRPIHLGAAGGLGTPRAIAAAFSLGADYVLTGSVNQGCVESGLHSSGKEMLAQAGLSDVVMAPAADMFELGVEVQVLQRGTMFGVRAKKLYELYRHFEGLEQIPKSERNILEKSIFKMTTDEAWDRTRSYWSKRDPNELSRAERDPKHQMALVFRSYLGQSSKWAIAGESDRALDYQIWCGPAMGAFNDWVRGSFLEKASNRTVAQVALNLLEGAAVISRAQQLRSYGVAMPSNAFDFNARQLTLDR